MSTYIKDGLDYGSRAAVTRNNQMLPAGITMERRQCSCDHCHDGYHETFEFEGWYKNALQEEIKEAVREVFETEII